MEPERSTPLITKPTIGHEPRLILPNYCMPEAPLVYSNELQAHPIVSLISLP